MPDYFPAIERAVAQAFPDCWAAYSRRGGAINAAALQRGVLNTSVPYEAALDNRSTWQEAHRAVLSHPDWVPKLRANGIVSCDGDCHQNKLKLPHSPDRLASSRHSQSSCTSTALQRTQCKLFKPKDAAHMSQVRSHALQVQGTVNKPLRPPPSGSPGTASLLLASERTTGTRSPGYLENSAGVRSSGGQTRAWASKDHGLRRSETTAGALRIKPRTLEERSRFRAKSQLSRSWSSLHDAGRLRSGTREGSVSPSRSTAANTWRPGFGIGSQDREQKGSLRKGHDTADMTRRQVVSHSDPNQAISTCQGDVKASHPRDQSTGTSRPERGDGRVSSAPGQSHQTEEQQLETLHQVRTGSVPWDGRPSAPSQKCPVQDGGIRDQHMMEEKVRPTTADSITVTPSMIADTGQEHTPTCKESGVPQIAIKQGLAASEQRGNHVAKPRHGSSRDSSHKGGRQPAWESSTLLDVPLSKQLQAAAGCGHLSGALWSSVSVPWTRNLSRVKDTRTAVKNYLRWHGAELQRLRQHRLDVERAVNP